MLDLHGVVADIERMIGCLIGEDIELVTALGSTLWHVRADRGQLEQVLVNLTVNARDAMPDGGKLTIETANAQLDEDDAASSFEVTPGQYVMIAVRDTGAGMTA